MDDAGAGESSGRGTMMRSRALLVWFGLLVAAFANGAVREFWLAPRVGEGSAQPALKLSDGRHTE